MVDSCECGNEPPSSIKCGECSLFLPGRAKDLSAPLSSNAILSGFIIHVCTIICTLIVFLLYYTTMMVARVTETGW